MSRDKKIEAVNICIVNGLRIDEEYRMMILEPLIRSLDDDNKAKLLELFINKESK